MLVGGAAITAYMSLIRDLVPNKRYLAVLQSFAYADQFSATALQKFPADLVEKDRLGPSATESAEMARAAIRGGAEIIVWFGGAYTPKSSAPHWRAVLKVTKQLAGNK